MSVLAKKERQPLSLTEGSVGKALIRFALPFFISSIFQVLYGAADVTFMGRFATAGAISGVSTGGSIMNLITNLFMGITSGGTVLIGQYFGAKRSKDTTAAITSTAFMCLVISVVVMILQLVFGKFLIKVLSVPPEAVDECWNYLKICSFGNIFIMGYNITGSLLRGLGNSTAPMVFVGIACLSNIVLDYVFVALLGLAASGAALATVISQFISFALACLYIWKTGFPYDFHKEDIRVDRKIIANMFRLGVPMSLQNTLVSLSFLVITKVTNQMGVNAAAGASLVGKVVDIGMTFPWALSSALSTITAQNIGAGKPERAKKSAFYGMAFSLCIGIPFVTTAHIIPRQLLGLLTTDMAVIEAGVGYLYPFSWDCILVCFMFCLNGLFNGSGKTAFVAAHSMATAFLVRIPIAYFMSRIDGATLFHVGLGTPAASVVSLILCVYFFRKHYAGDKIKSIQMIG